MSFLRWSTASECFQFSNFTVTRLVVWLHSFQAAVCGSLQCLKNQHQFQNVYWFWLRIVQGSHLKLYFNFWFWFSSFHFKTSSCKRRATTNFSGQGRSRGIRSLYKHFVKNTRKKCAAGKNLGVFSPRYP